MSGIVSFILFLGPLVFVHELGHFLFAKLFNIKCEVFSIGFGPKILKKQYGETEYAISAIPLGGYVKIFGEDPTAELTPEEKSRALAHQAKWKRFLVIFGGPWFNIVFTFILFLFLFGIGEQKLVNEIGRVIPNSPAYEAGLRSGDKILRIQDTEINLYEEFARELQKYPDQKINLLVQSTAGQEKSLSVFSKGKLGMNKFGEKVKMGHIPGIDPRSRASVLSVTDPNTPAGVAGLQTGDLVQALKAKLDRLVQTRKKRPEIMPTAL